MLKKTLEFVNFLIIVVFFLGYDEVMAQTQPVGPPATTSAEKAKEAGENFANHILKVSDEMELYRLLKMVVPLLNNTDQMIALSDKAIIQLEKSEKENREVFKTLNLAFVSNQSRIDKAKDDLKKMRERYAVVANAYNTKMAETGYKFTDPAKLPNGVTEVLPKQFAIR